MSVGAVMAGAAKSFISILIPYSRKRYALDSKKNGFRVDQHSVIAQKNCRLHRVFPSGKSLFESGRMALIPASSGCSPSRKSSFRTVRPFSFRKTRPISRWKIIFPSAKAGRMALIFWIRPGESPEDARTRGRMPRRRIFVPGDFRRIESRIALISVVVAEAGAFRLSGPIISTASSGLHSSKIPVFSLQSTFCVRSPSIPRLTGRNLSKRFHALQLFP